MTPQCLDYLRAIDYHLMEVKRLENISLNNCIDVHVNKLAQKSSRACSGLTVSVSKCPTTIFKKARPIIVTLHTELCTTMQRTLVNFPRAVFTVIPKVLLNYTARKTEICALSNDFMNRGLHGKSALLVCPLHVVTDLC